MATKGFTLDPNPDGTSSGPSGTPANLTPSQQAQIEASNNALAALAGRSDGKVSGAAPLVTAPPGSLDADGNPLQAPVINTGAANAELNSVQTTAQPAVSVGTPSGAAPALSNAVKGQGNGQEGPEGAVAGETTAQARARIEGSLRAKLGNAGAIVSIMGGIGIAIAAAIFLARLDATNANVHINSINIDNLPASDTLKTNHVKATVFFDRSRVYSRSGDGTIPRSDTDAFNPVPGDVVSFNGLFGATPFNKEYRIYESGRTSFSIKMLKTDVNITFGNSSRNTRSPVYTPGQATTYTYTAGDDGVSPDIAMVYSNLTNQLLGEALNFTLSLIAAASQAAAAAAAAVAPIINAAGGAAKAGFCAAVPIFCDSTIWIIIGLIIAGIVAFIILT